MGEGEAESSSPLRKKGQGATCMASAGFSEDFWLFPDPEAVSPPEIFSLLAFCSASFLALALALADVDSTAVGSFTVDSEVGGVVGRGYSNREGLAFDRSSKLGTLRS